MDFRKANSGAMNEGQLGPLTGVSDEAGIIVSPSAILI